MTIATCERGCVRSGRGATAFCFCAVLGGRRDVIYRRARVCGLLTMPRHGVGDLCAASHACLASRIPPSARAPSRSARRRSRGAGGGVERLTNAETGTIKFNRMREFSAPCPWRRRRRGTGLARSRRACCTCRSASASRAWSVHDHKQKGSLSALRAGHRLP